MKLWFPLILFLLIINSISSWYLSDYHDALIKSPDYSNPSSTDSIEEDHRSSLGKRSQRNANILYRYCRRNGQAPNFCLKYAVRMIFATGH